MPTDPGSINRSLMRKTPLTKKPSKGKLDIIKEKQPKERKPSTDSTTSNPDSPSMEGSRPALPAEPGTLKVSLATIPRIDKMTEKESAHPSPQQLSQLTHGGGANGVSLMSHDETPVTKTTISSQPEDLSGIEMTRVDGSQLHPSEIGDHVSTSPPSSVTDKDEVSPCASPVGQPSAAVDFVGSPLKFPRSQSMPLSKSSPGSKKSKSKASSPSGLQIQRSFSVLSAGVIHLFILLILQHN